MTVPSSRAGRPVSSPGPQLPLVSCKPGLSGTPLRVGFDDILWDFFYPGLRPGLKVLKAVV